jgi:hypothetical protein
MIKSVSKGLCSAVTKSLTVFGKGESGQEKNYSLLNNGRSTVVKNTTLYK